LLSQIDPKFAQKVVHPKESVRADLPDIALPPTHKRILRETFLQRNFSVSALNNFLKCPWKYVARNLLLVPEPPEWSALLGTACHNALKIFHTNAKKRKVLGKKGLKKLINQCILAEPFTASDLPVALEKAERSILAYADSFVPFKKGEKISVENSEAFVYRVKDGRDDFGITVTGKIDLSKETNGRTRVIDFKTKKRMTRNEIEGKTKNSEGAEMRQLQFYKFLLENSRKGCEVSLGTLTFLSPERGKVLSETFELNDVDKEKIEETVRKALLSIYRLDFWGKTCGEKNCEYCKLYHSLV
ncbi:MAG TPA: PD-(D/E)XK nuclease family protein, partial [Candidatus Paceibacterota bacterium]